MSNFDKLAIGKEVEGLDVSPQFDAYSGVEIIIDDDTSVFSGNRSGRVLTIQNPWGTQEQADNILSNLTASGFQYQPYEATNAILNPAAELGDGVTINNVYSGIYTSSKNFTPLMATDISAPQDEAIDHEYPYEPQTDRVFRRQISEAKAAITINENAIAAEVLRATNAEESLSSSLTQTATEIRANVVSKTGGSSSSFGWALDDSSWTLTSNGQTVLRATSSGIEINGTVNATTGKIGGFTITASSLYNGMNNLGSTSNGVYIGTDGISVGGGKFKVTSSGAVSAANMTLTGTLNIGGTAITAAALRSGAQSAYSNGGYWSSGAGYGYNYNSATTNNTSSYPSYFTCGSLRCNYIKLTGNFMVGTTMCSLKTKTFMYGIGITRSQQYVTAITPYTDTITYIGA